MSSCLDSKLSSTSFLLAQCRSDLISKQLCLSEVEPLVPKKRVWLRNYVFTQQKWIGLYLGRIDGLEQQLEILKHQREIEEERGEKEEGEKKEEEHSDVYKSVDRIGRRLKLILDVTDACCFLTKSDLDPNSNQMSNPDPKSPVSPLPPSPATTNALTFNMRTLIRHITVITRP